MIRLLLAGAMWAGTACLSSAQPERAQPQRGSQKPAAPKGSEPIELVFMRDQGPLVLRLHVLAGGQPVHVRWQQYVERWFDYLDRHNRGALNQKELQGAPNAANMRNLAAQGGFIPNRGVSLTLRDFGKSSDQAVSRDEFIAYYKKNGIVPIQMTFAPIEATARANAALFKTLDANGDGKLSLAEVAAGKSLAAAFDVNDDELVSAEELAPGMGPVSGRSIAVQPPLASGPASSASYFHVNGEAARFQLAFLLLARYDKNTNKHLSPQEIGLDEAAFGRLDSNGDGTLDLGELAHVPARASSVTLVAHVRSGKLPPLTALGAKFLPAPAVRLTGNQASITLSDADITVQNLDAGPVRPVFNQFAFLVKQIKAADTKMRGYVELKDLDAPQLQFVRQLFPILDRDEDGKLTDKETQAYFDLQGQGRDVFASFSVQEQGRNWLQLIDANRDNQLSPRELMTAWQRLQVHDKNGDGAIDAQELPLQFKVVLNSSVNQQFVAVAAAGMRSSGPARNAYPPQAPVWFKKMDRNGDGDVSRREFLGSPEDFERFDRNGDRLLDADEAAAAVRKQ